MNQLVSLIIVYKKNIYEYLISAIQEAVIYQNSNENKNMVIDFGGNCNGEMNK